VYFIYLFKRTDSNKSYLNSSALARQVFTYYNIIVVNNFMTHSAVFQCYNCAYLISYVYCYLLLIQLNLTSSRYYTILYRCPMIIINTMTNLDPNKLNRLMNFKLRLWKSKQVDLIFLKRFFVDFVRCLNILYMCVALIVIHTFVYYINIF